MSKPLQPITLWSGMLLDREIEYVARWGRFNEPPKWSPLTLMDLKDCLEEKPDEKLVDRLFPGGTFFGPFINPANSIEKLDALAVLRFVLNLHALLDGPLPELKVSKEDELYEVVEIVENVIKEEWGINLERGEGYSEKLNPKENSIPTCEIWTLKIPLSESYKQWLVPRVDACTAIGKLVNSPRLFYLLVNYHCEVIDDDSPYLLLKIHGTQSIRPEYNTFLDDYDALPNAKPLNGFELYAGYLALADTLATIHLSGTMPAVLGGEMLSVCGGDSLTDLWVKCYDKQEAGYVRTGSCKVCGRLFVSGNSKMQGHPACMNQLRVRRSRLKKYQELVSSGKTQEEASAIAKIAIKTAEEMIELEENSNPTLL